MSNIIPANIQIPAHLAARVGTPSVLGAAMAGGISSGASGPRISIKASRFRIIEGDTETVLDTIALDVVIVGANPRLSKTWYAKKWNPDSEPSAPDCFSLDGIAPDPESESPQSDLCASCPQNAWGSRVTDNGQQVKACADQKRLAIVSADDPEGPIYLLQVTPAALKGLNQYHKELSMRGIPAEVVRTRVTFDSDASFPKLQFTFAGFLDAETQAVVDQLFGSERVREITGESVQSQPAAIPATPKPTLVAPKPAPAPAPVAAPEPAPAPAAPKRGFGAAKPAAAPKAVKPVAAAPAPAPAPAAAEAASSLADEIAALVGEVAADDA